jgi:hypothetical protein
VLTTFFIYGHYLFGETFGLSIYADSIKQGLIKYTPNIGAITTVYPGINGRMYRK